MNSEQLSAATRRLNNGQRAEPEPLTIAYIAKGAGAALARFGGLPEAVIDHYSGELGFIQSAIDYALLLDTLADDRVLTGVFAYEVAEEFGERFAESACTGPVSDERARQLAREVVDACAAPAEPENPERAALHEALELLKQGRHTSARVRIEEALK